MLSVGLPRESSVVMTVLMATLMTALMTTLQARPDDMSLVPGFLEPPGSCPEQVGG